MKTKYLATMLGLLGVAAVTPAAMAATTAASFSGFYISGAGGQKSSNVEETVTGGGASGSIKLGDTSMFGQLAGGYNFAPGGDFRLGIGAFYDIGDGKAGSATATVGAVTATYDVKETRHYGISVEPGFAITRDSVAYVKLTYNWIKGQETLSGATTGSGSNTFSAFGYGLGLKHLISNNAFLYAEWQQIQYNTSSFAVGASTVSYKPSQSLGLVGIGMIF